MQHHIERRRQFTQMLPNRGAHAPANAVPYHGSAQYLADRKADSRSRVAIGLAIAADTDAELTLVDRYARTFGVFREAAAGREITFDAIFAPDTALPGRDAPLTRTRAYRAAHNVGHYRFFECSALDAAGRPRGDMTLFGDVHFPFDANVEAAATTPVERLASDGPRIEESYSLDERGIVEVVIRNLDQGYERSFKLGA